MREDIIKSIGEEYYNKLDLDGFSNMMKDPSYCYKFFWLEAIVNLISEGKITTTFNDLIDEMKANAWYSVMEPDLITKALQNDRRLIKCSYFI